MQRSVKEKHIKLGARKRLNHFLSFRVRWNCKERSARVKCELRQRHQETTKKHPLISFPVRVLGRNESAKSSSCTGNWIFCRNFAAAHRFRGRRAPSEKASFIRNLWAACKWDGAAAAKALKQQRELASERTLSLHSIFPHTAHQTLGARTYLVSVPVSPHSQKRAPWIYLYFSQPQPIYLCNCHVLHRCAHEMEINCTLICALQHTVWKAGFFHQSGSQVDGYVWVRLVLHPVE